jgi:hypothetical protein
MNRIMSVSPKDMSKADRNAMRQNVWPPAVFFKPGVAFRSMTLRFMARHPVIAPAINYGNTATSLLRPVGMFGLDSRFIWSV